MGRPEQRATSASDDHHPASEDWPRGYGEASWWPLVVAVGASGIYAGAGLFVLGRGHLPLIGSTVGPLVFIAGMAAFLAGLYGWTYHAFVKRFPGRAGRAVSRRFRWATWLFLAAEAATFGAGFGYYFYVRAGPWPPGELPHLVSSLVMANTALLVASSVTMHFAHDAIRAGERRRFLGLLGTTVLLGLGFLAGQVWEYYEFIIREGFTLAGGMFASAFFGLTGLHGLHVSLGVVLLGVLLVRALAGQFSADHHLAVTTVSMYWHFVDAVWIFLVVTLYVGATVP